MEWLLMKELEMSNLDATLGSTLETHIARECQIYYEFQSQL